MDMDIDDRDMVRVAAGCQESFERIVDRHRRRLILWLRLHTADAEDVAQEVLFSVFKAAGRYTPQGTFSAWLFAMAKNRVIDYVRRANSRKSSAVTLFSEIDYFDVQSSDEEPCETVSRRDLLARVNEILDMIPKEQSDAIRFYVEGASHSELARADGTCRQTMTSRVRLAKEKVLSKISGGSIKKPKRPVGA